MCDGYWDPKLRQWVWTEEGHGPERTDQELDALLEKPIQLAPPAPETKRRPALLGR